MAVKPTLRQRKREAIISASVAEFREKGYQQASMDSIAARAEVSKRTVYNHFASKEALFRAIIEQVMTQFAMLTDVRYNPELSMESQLRDFAVRELEMLGSAHFQDLIRVLMPEMIHQPELASEAMCQFDEQEHGLNAWFQAAMDDGKLHPVEPDYAANMFMGMIKAHALMPQLMGAVPFPGAELCERIVDDTVFMFLARFSKEQTKS